MSSTLIVGIIIIALIILPIWYLMHSQSSGKRKLEKELSALGKKGKINITEHESWGNKVIGLDRENEHALFFAQGTPENRLIITDLRKFIKCTVERNLLDTKNDENTILYSSIRINFIPRNTSAEEVSFPIFSEEEDMTVSNELQIANEWSEKLNVVMRKRN